MSDLRFADHHLTKCNFIYTKGSPERQTNNFVQDKEYLETNDNRNSKNFNNLMHRSNLMI